MLQRITAYLLIFSLVTVNFTRLFIYAGFELNRNYIAEKLCENRDKPWMNCNGKCYFMKKIKQAEQNKNAEEKQAQKNLFQEAAFHKTADVSFHPILLAVILHPFANSTALERTNTIFQPPRQS
ncbi:hypothetical protein DYU05_14470 [Mucilaginibacter terrenus]|uniref:Uncharacterized protein n=1 Tax=Mucilaginibacter terrenus TaxID=2482727 RepID=A0A3E2NQR3_9SPHI|nr:hypothetical protein [Mucilaginibacter terrenus]RFZ83336.1 hypothetical protein DYU05_14470 [Mucilaginibacter terrenus]